VNNGTRGGVGWGWRWLLVLGLCVSAAAMRAQDVDKLPAPTGYVSDFANVLDQDAKQQLDALCAELDQKAHAQIAVVTVQSLNGDSIEDYAVRLEEKWKVGAKGTDRGVLMLFAMNDHRDRIEVGYGLEGLLNDAKVGDILRSVKPELQQGDDSSAVSDAVKQVANDIAADANVTLDQTGPVRHRVRQSANVGIGPVLRVIFFIIVMIVIFGMQRGGRGGRGGGGGSGLGWFLLGNFLGSSGGYRGGGDGGGWGGGDGGGGGGFGGFGGGGSGGGGASGSW
jgi:uncharacterized protein